MDFGIGCVFENQPIKEMNPEDIGLVEMTRSAIIGGDDPELEEMDDTSGIYPER
jgi:hypothetical protein